MSILDEAIEIESTIVSHRRYLHENAEIGQELPVTRAYVKGRLEELGYSPIELGGGIVAIAGGKKTGKTFLLRADMDGLPIKEDSDLPYKSKTENMHACGHDFHTSALLGAAQILKKHEDEIEGAVKLMFQPAEETLTGAYSMIKEGVLENPSVDAGMMLHVISGIPIPTGCVTLPRPGVGSSSADWFEIHVQGKGCHGAMPNNGVDPLNVITHIFIALQEINARESAYSDNLALTIGQIHGGKTSNVIPDTAYMTGTIRTLDKNVRQMAKKRLVEISEGIAKAFRAGVEVKFTNECPSVVDDEKVCAELTEYITGLLGESKAITMQKSVDSMAGSEDFSFLSEKIPTASIYLTAGSVDEGHTHSLHHPKVTFNENALPVGAAVYAACAIEWLKNN